MEPLRVSACGQPLRDRIGVVIVEKLPLGREVEIGLSTAPPGEIGERVGVFAARHNGGVVELPRLKLRFRFLLGADGNEANDYDVSGDEMSDGLASGCHDR